MDQQKYDDYDYDMRDITREDDEKYMRRFFEIVFESGDTNGLTPEDIMKYQEIFIDVMEKYKNDSKRIAVAEEMRRRDPNAPIQIIDLNGLGDEDDIGVQIAEIQAANKADVEREVKLCACLKELIAKQVALAKINVAIFIKQGKEKISAKVDELDDIVKTSKEEEEALKAEYEAALDKLDVMYKDYLKQMLDYKKEKEAEELKIISKESEILSKRTEQQNTPEYKEFTKKKERLKMEIREAIDFENGEDFIAKAEELSKLLESDTTKKYDEELAELAKQKQEIRAKIQECKDEMDDFDRLKNEGYDLLKTKKNDRMKLIKKPTILQSLFAKVLKGFGKIGGFNRDIVDEVKDLISQAKGAYYKSEEERLNKKLVNMDPVYFDVYVAGKMDAMLQEQEVEMENDNLEKVMGLGEIGLGEEDEIQKSSEDYVKKIREVMKAARDEQKADLKAVKEQEAQERREKRQEKRQDRKERVHEATQYLKEEIVRSMEERIAKKQEKLDDAQKKYNGQERSQDNSRG